MKPELIFLLDKFCTLSQEKQLTFARHFIGWMVGATDVSNPKTIAEEVETGLLASTKYVEEKKELQS